MPKSVRHQNLARKAALAAGPQVDVYRITDPHHTPDLRGEFAGVKVQTMGGEQVVRLTPKQAKFYIDSGVLEKVERDDEGEAA